MLAFLEQGGIILVLILILSVMAAIIIVERLLYFRRLKTDESSFLRRLQQALDKGYYEEALSICEANKGPLANLMQVGIENRGLSPEMIKSTITDAANMEIPRLERNLSFLGTIGHISPLLGLLGTVTGNIEVFGVLSSSGAVSDPSVLAGGISEALVTTAAGIIVSIPVIMFYNHLVSKVNHSIIKLENKVTELVLLLQGQRNAL